MRQTGSGPGFPLKSGQTCRIPGKLSRQNFHRYLAVQLLILRQEHLAHATGAQFGLNEVSGW